MIGRQWKRPTDRPRPNRPLKIQPLAERLALAGDAPSFTEIADAVVEVGAPLHVPLDASDADSEILSVSVEVADENAVEAEVITGNRSLRLDVAGFGTMLFELFEQRAPRPTARVIELVESGFYDGLLFHRVDDGFVLQGGDPNGDGTGGSSLGNFDDQFHPDLQHNRPGVLSFAKTTDDTNNSQFFITEQTPRHLDFNHSVFGQLVEGEDVREAISKVAVDMDDRPLDPVVIESATIINDTQNAVVLLRALQEDAQTDLTVTVMDDDGNTFRQTIAVTTTADASDAAPYLADLPSDAVVVAGESYGFALPAVDLEDDDVSFVGQYASDPAGSTASLDSATGAFLVNTADDFVGEIDFAFGVRRTVPDSHIDTQLFQLRVASRYLNPDDPYDVDHSTEVTANDALLIINALNRSGGTISLPVDDALVQLNDTLDYNVNGDLQISAQDALLVINRLARGRANPSASGEALLAPPATTTVPDQDEDDPNAPHVGSLF